MRYFTYFLLTCSLVSYAQSDLDAFLDDPNQAGLSNIQKSKAATNAKKSETIEPRKDFERKHVKDSDDSCLVMQGEFAAASASNVPALKTFGVGPCAVVIIYDKKNKVGALGHLDTMTNVSASIANMKNSIKKLAKSAEPTDESDLQAYVIGGDITSKMLLYHIKLQLGTQLPNTKVNWDVISQNFEDDTAWLDLNSGTVSQFQVDTKLKSNKRDLDPRMAFYSMSETANPLIELDLKKCIQKTKLAPEPAKTAEDKNSAH